MTSIRQRILETLRERLRLITKGESFDTDAGQFVALGELPQFGPDDIPVGIAMMVGDELAAPPGQKLKTMIQLPIEIQVVAQADLDEPWVAIEAALADVERALEKEDRTLGGIAHTFERGPVRTLPREASSPIVGTGVTYVVSFSKTWGAP